MVGSLEIPIRSPKRAGEGSLPPDEPTQQARGASASSAEMLRAIAQLLIEKGAFTRDEFVDPLLAISKPKGGA